MKIALLVLFFFISLSAAQAENCIFVSDYDDTLKVSHSNSLPDAGVRGAFSDRMFAGAPEFLKTIQTYCKSYILSSSPTLIRSIIKETLRENGVINLPKIILRNFLTDRARTYKLSKLSEILIENSATENFYIFLGDDTEQDPEIYHRFMELNPTLKARTFIHQVNQRETLENQSGFTIYPQLVDFLQTANASQKTPIIPFTNDEQNRMLTAFFSADLENVVPSFGKCPKGDLEKNFPNETIRSTMERVCPSR